MQLITLSYNFFFNEQFSLRDKKNLKLSDLDGMFDINEWAANITLYILNWRIVYSPKCYYKNNLHQQQ